MLPKPIVGLVLGNEKAITGGIVTGILMLLGQVGVSGQMTLQEALTAAAAWVVAHAVIWLTTNTQKA